MPAYNAEKYIGEAIQSVINQTYPNWELLIADDGSTDRTSEICKQYSICDKRIKFVSTTNKGVSSARNNGLDCAYGEYVTFLDSDDTFPNDSLAVRVNILLENPHIDIVGGKVTVLDEKLEKVIYCKCPEYTGRLLEKLLSLDGQIFAGICYLTKKVIIGDARFKNNMTNAEDLLFWIELSAKKNLIYTSIVENIYNCRLLNNSASNNKNGWREGIFKLIKYINNNKDLLYFETIAFRVKIAKMLISYHCKNKCLIGFFDLFFVFKKW
ncbi:MAG: glycosyltransferase family 2 protein [Methylococcales bacterium]|nr:glycosyltransferase family 2 protein [Methylococcales bacterium]